MTTEKLIEKMCEYNIRNIDSNTQILVEIAYQLKRIADKLAGNKK